MAKNFFVYDGVHGYAMPEFKEDDRLNAPSLYRPSRALQNAVNVALHLGKPLLLTGEPGSGKTQLAHNIAWTFQLGKPFIFNTRTNSKASDLFYAYNALAHLQYSQNPHNKALSDDETEQRFIHYQALGKAIQSNKRQVVLIDEIDKAPRDLPNDILNVLEDLTFDVPEVNKSYSASTAARPLIIMTSNSEKNLPDAFLRRCIYQHLMFPDAQHLFDILANKIESQFYSQEVLRQIIIPHFLMIRGLLKRKKPGTAELIMWVTLLTKLEFAPQLIENFNFLETSDKQRLMMSYNVLAKTEEDLTTLGLLIHGAPSTGTPA